MRYLLLLLIPLLLPFNVMAVETFTQGIKQVKLQCTMATQMVDGSPIVADVHRVRFYRPDTGTVAGKHSGYSSNCSLTSTSAVDGLPVGLYEVCVVTELNPGTATEKTSAPLCVPFEIIPDFIPPVGVNPPSGLTLTPIY